MPYLKKLEKNPYTYLKAKLYMELSSILVFLLLRTNIRPNTITLIYAFCGILGFVFLSLLLKTLYLFH